MSNSASSSDNTVITMYRSNNISTDPSRMELVPAQSYLAKNKEIALQKLYMFNSVFNVKSSVYNNSQFQYTFPTSSGTQTYSVVMTDGYYDVDAISAYINFIQKQNGNYLIDNTGSEVYYTTLQVNSVAYGVTISQTPFPTSLPTNWTTPSNFSGFPAISTTPQIIVGSNDFGLLIGYTAGSYPATPQTSFYSTNGTLVAQIDPAYTYFVSTQLVNLPYVNTKPSAIYNFSFKDVPFGSQLAETPTNLLWYSVTDGNYKSFVIYFVDQDNKPMLIKDLDIQVTLIIRDKQPQV